MRRSWPRTSPSSVLRSLFLCCGVIGRGLMGDLESARDLVQALPLPAQPPDLLDDVLRQLRPAMTLAVRPRLGNASADPLGDERALKLGDRGDDREHRLAHGG